jgi:hypothetical protein
VVIPEEVRQQLKDRFEAALSGPVHLTLYTKPGSSRLILPEGFGCPTCEDAREMAELLRDAAPEKITLEQVDVTRNPERATADGIDDVPTIALASNSYPLPNPPHKGEGEAGLDPPHKGEGEAGLDPSHNAEGGAGRIRFQGLATGTEFPALIDAVERVSRNDPGLRDESLAALAKLTEPAEVMVFATPT